MNQIHIHIDHIALKLQGGDEAIAHSLAHSLGPALLQALAQQPEILARLQNGRSPHPINLDLGKLPISSNQDTGSINQSIVQGVAGAIANPYSVTRA